MKGPDPRVEEILARFSADGGRRTASRQAIVETVVGAKGHLTAEQIADQVQARFPSVNLSTVYRTLETLEELGVVDHVHLGHGRAVYHLADQTHQHLFCETCERVEELPITKLRPLFAMLEREFGFELDRRHFAIVGRCRSCRA
ncbi:MAG: Fur family transcriptional regulator [Acidimicrobiia bacterium]